jgi:hypothetical protein
MKPTPSIALATWMLDHLTLGAPNESLSGDLLEELHSGRSTTWYWRQTLSAVAVTLSTKSRAYTMPLAFSFAWSIIYTALWPSIVGSHLTQTIVQQLTAHDLPYSTGLHFVSAIAPAAIFIWIGFFVYLTLRNHESRRPSTLRLLASLSISLNVLFVTIIGEHLRHSGIDLRNVSRENFNAHLAALCIPLALSLWAALICAGPPAQHRYPGSLTV